MDEKETKPISVNGDVTPITQKEVKTVNANEWETLNVTQLYEQLSILQDRLIMAYELKNVPLATHLQKGIDHLQKILSTKVGNTGIF